MLQMKKQLMPVAFSALMLALVPLPQTLHAMKVPIVLCGGMNKKTVYVPASSALGQAHRKDCPFCLLFGNSPLCLLLMQLMS